MDGKFLGGFLPIADFFQIVVFFSNNFYFYQRNTKLIRQIHTLTKQSNVSKR